LLAASAEQFNQPVAATAQKRQIFNGFPHALWALAFTKAARDWTFERYECVRNFVI
jgi:hypothetical protein